jgi:hypothetical protein
MVSARHNKMKDVEFKDRKLKIIKSFSTNPTAGLLLKGRWLEQAGFAIGDRVRVQIQNKRLVVTVLEQACAGDGNVKTISVEKK